MKTQITKLSYIMNKPSRCFYFFHDSHKTRFCVSRKKQIVDLDNGIVHTRMNTEAVGNELVVTPA